MIAFTNKEKEKLAAVTGLAPIQVDKLITMGLIDYKNALKAIVKHDAFMLKRKRLYRVAEIHRVLAERYGTSIYFIKQCMAKERKAPRYHCIRCGKEITWKIKKKNLGKCDACLLDDMRADLT